MIEEPQLREWIAAERRELAAVLTALPAESWNAATLCAGWRVREVVAHMTMPYRYSGRQVMLELLRARGSFNRAADRCARRDTRTLSAERLADCLRDNAEHPWKPPRGGYAGALTHDVVHGLDFTLPLGIDRRIPEERLRPVMDGLAAPRSLKYFGVDLDGVRLEADDLDWGYGSGARLSGGAQALTALLCGRRLPAGRLTGAPAARFASRGGDPVRDGSGGRPSGG
jgi:uncharacterized protein (TIGR03083 family)